MLYKVDHSYADLIGINDSIITLWSNGGLHIEVAYIAINDFGNNITVAFLVDEHIMESASDESIVRDVNLKERIIRTFCDDVADELQRNGTSSGIFAYDFVTEMPFDCADLKAGQAFDITGSTNGGISQRLHVQQCLRLSDPPVL